MERTARLSLHSRGGAVEIGGNDVSHAVRGVRLEQTAGSPPRITLDILVYETDIDGEAEVNIPEATAALLVTLGWVPPDTPALTAESIRDTANQAAAHQALRRAAQHNPDWFSALMRREARLQGRASL